MTVVFLSQILLLTNLAYALSQSNIGYTCLHPALSYDTTSIFLHTAWDLMYQIFLLLTYFGEFVEYL